LWLPPFGSLQKSVREQRRQVKLRIDRLDFNTGFFNVSMTLKDGLIAARSRIVILCGLLATGAIIWTLESMRPEGRLSKAQINETVTTATSQPKILRAAGVLPLAPPQALTPEERVFARVAWKYFENNLQPATGLVNSVDNFTASTMWDTGSYLMAVVSAQKLGIITPAEATERLQAALRALRAMPLFDNELPNKSYNTVTNAMVDYNNQPTPRGIGWSAVDVGRLFVPLNVIAWNYPALTAEARELMQRFEFRNALREGVLYGALVDSGRTKHPQEGRLGYEEYAAKSYALMGKDVFAALKYDDFLHYERIYGVDVPTDSRTPDRYKAFNYVVSEPYILAGMELGFDDVSREFAAAVYRAQQARFETTGILTAVSEDNIDTAPYFVYNTVFTAGKAWACITDQGADASAFRSISTKAAFGWHVLYRTPYTSRVLDAVKSLYDPERGWYSGLYEKTQQPNKAITANTNAIILEALCYKQFGRHINLLK
jgi:hypothetical protein